MPYFDHQHLDGHLQAIHHKLNSFSIRHSILFWSRVVILLFEWEVKQGT